MNKIQLSINEITTTPLFIGFEGENEHTEVTFYWTILFSQYPSAVATFVIRPPQGEAYPKVITQDGNKVVWEVSASDTTIPGKGEYQLTFINGTEIIKSYIGTYSVMDSIVGNGEAPTPVEDWIAQANEKLAEVEDTIAEIPGMVEDDVAESVSSWLEENIDPDTGYVIDKTLTVENAAADAKKVGEVFATKAPVIEESVTSAEIASFTDGADGMPMKLTVGIEPVQDLHGQESPYPAGGGKNLIPPINTQPESGEVIVEYPTEKTLNGFSISMKFSGSFENAGAAFIDLQDADGNHGYITPATLGLTAGTTYTKQAASYSSAETKKIKKIIYFRYPNFTNPVFDDLMLEQGSTPTTYAPYSNICPITGWTGAEVTRMGKNLCDPTAIIHNGLNSDGTIDSGADERYRTVEIQSLPAGTYTISTDLPDCFFTRKVADGVVSGISLATQSYTFTSTTKGRFAITFRTDPTSTISTEPNVMLEIGSSASSYSAYSGATYPISWQTEAGTVYGGTLTVNKDGTGTLTVDRKMATYNGSENWQVRTGKTWSFGVDAPSDIKQGNALSLYEISNAFKPSADVWGSPVYGILNNYTQIIVGYPKAEGNVDTFKAYLSANPLQVCYELATPVTYNLTNLELIETLKGINNVWSDTGETAVDYPADTKLYIAKVIASLS